MASQAPIEWSVRSATAATPTTATVWIMVRGVTADTVNYKIDGGTTAFISVATDIMGFEELTGLNADTEYEIEFVTSGEKAIFKTLPVVSNTEEVVLALGGCGKSETYNQFGKIVDDMAPDAFIFLGDTPYTNRAQVAGQWDVASGADEIGEFNVTTGDIYNHHQVFGANIGVGRIAHGRPTFWTWDDHEFQQNNWDHSQQYSEVQVITDLNYLTVQSAWHINHPDQPFVTTNDGTDKPELTSLPATVYTSQYYSFKTGMVEVFVLDCIGAKSEIDVGGTEGAGHLMLGANQETWLTEGVRDSTATYKLIVSSKPVSIGYVADEDHWANYQIQFGRILDQIATDGATGVIWAGADFHIAAYTHAALTDGDSWDLAGIATGPMSSLGWPPSAVDGTNHTFIGDKENAIVQERTIGKLEFTEAKVTATIINVRNEVLFTGTLLPTENKWHTTVGS